MTKVEELEQKLIILNKMHTSAKEDFESISNELNECQKALAELKESKKEGKWKPKYDEKYWYRDDCGTEVSEYWVDDDYDEWRYNNIPIFKTKEKCKSYEFSKEEWKDTDIAKWRIDYDFGMKTFRADDNYAICVFDAIYFKTEEDAQYIIDNFKEELMEYWI